MLKTAAATTPFIRGEYANIWYHVPRDVDLSCNAPMFVDDGKIASGIDTYPTDPCLLEYGLDDRVVHTDGLGNPMVAGRMLFRYEPFHWLRGFDEDMDLQGMTKRCLAKWLSHTLLSSIWPTLTSWSPNRS